MAAGTGARYLVSDCGKEQNSTSMANPFTYVQMKKGERMVGFSFQVPQLSGNTQWSQKIPAQRPIKHFRNTEETKAIPQTIPPQNPLTARYQRLD